MLGSLADPPPWPDKKYILRTLESPYISHFSYTPLLGVKVENHPGNRYVFSECQAKLWQVTCFGQRGPLLVSDRFLYTDHTHLVLSIHLSLKMPYISAIHSQSFDAMQYLIRLKFYLCVCVTLCSQDFVGFEYLPMLTICKAQLLYLVSGAVLLFPISVLMKQFLTGMINCRKMIFEYKIICRTWMYMVHCNMAWS